MDQYEESNSTIWARHPKLFKNDPYQFDASKELVTCTPFDFINGFVVGQLYSVQYKGIFGVPDKGQTLYVW